MEKERLYSMALLRLLSQGIEEEDAKKLVLKMINEGISEDIILNMEVKMIEPSREFIPLLTDIIHDSINSLKEPFEIYENLKGSLSLEEKNALLISMVAKKSYAEGIKAMMLPLILSLDSGKSLEEYFENINELSRCLDNEISKYDEFILED